MPSGFYFRSQNSGYIRIVANNGRDLLETARGATLMLNCNSGGGLFYREEIEALLVMELSSPSNAFRAPWVSWGLCGQR